MSAHTYELSAFTCDLPKVFVPYPVILASASPRRNQLLALILEHFRVEPADIDETPLSGESAIETAKRLAMAKAQAVFSDNPSSLVIGADTIVVLRDGDSEHQLAKPEGRTEACEMLQRLSGKTHTVVTGVAVCSPRGVCVCHECSAVTFRALQRHEIEDYVETGEPMDKAGAYAIQAGGGTFVSNIEGSVSNVIGLPLETLHEMLQRF